jgi:hypothetical protein
MKLAMCSSCCSAWPHQSSALISGAADLLLPGLQANPYTGFSILCNVLQEPGGGRSRDGAAAAGRGHQEGGCAHG